MVCLHVLEHFFPNCPVLFLEVLLRLKDLPRTILNQRFQLIYVRRFNLLQLSTLAGHLDRTVEAVVQDGVSVSKFGFFICVVLTHFRVLIWLNTVFEVAKAQFFVSIEWKSHRLVSFRHDHVLKAWLFRSISLWWGCFSLCTKLYIRMLSVSTRRSLLIEHPNEII